MIEIVESALCSRAQLLERTLPESPAVDAAVREILDNVINNGDRALFEYAKKFDGAELSALEVSREEIDAAWYNIDDDFKVTLEKAAQNITNFHEMQRRDGFEKDYGDGRIVGQRILPLQRVGIYVPGGTASYPSTVLMNAVPARIAGVGEIIMVTPPSKDGKIKDEILAAARLAGVSRIFKIGGAGAVAALAYGTESVPAVDKIVGPGNVFVATSKRMVFGKVAIDMVAGPSEILVVADGKCNPAFVAADLLSQAEHDKLASAVLVTDSKELADKVSAQLEKQIPELERSEIARTSIDNNGKIIIVSDIAEAISISNDYAPEHLELCLDEPMKWLPMVQNAGSVFLGRFCPEALGDYFAGPNHTLPTSGTARFASPLGVDDFVKRSSYIYYTEDALSKDGRCIVDFAEREGLSAHGRSVSIRMESEDK